jgi:hypothetical protein
MLSEVQTKLYGISGEPTAFGCRILLRDRDVALKQALKGQSSEILIPFYEING